jgi:hypothetical protein
MGTSDYVVSGTTGILPIIGNTDPWPYWIATAGGTAIASNTITVTGTGTYTAAYPWDTWNANYGTSAITVAGNGPWSITTSQVIWTTWNGVWTANNVLASAGVGGTLAVIPREIPINRVKAKRLLKSLLTDEHEDSLVKKGNFDLTVGDRVYRVSPGGGVTRLGADGKADEAYCIHPDRALLLPLEDWAVAQKLLLETDEEEFLRIANKTRLRA